MEHMNEEKKIIGLFCFDGPLYKDVDGNYCSITINNEMIKRYLDVVDELYLLIRTFKSNKTYKELNMPKLDIQKVKVVELPNYYSVKNFLFRKKQYELIDKYVLKSDLIFARLPSQTSNMVLDRVTKLKKMYLAEIGGCAWDSFIHHGIKGIIMAPYMYYKEKKYVKKAEFCSYVTKEFLQRRYPTETKNVISCSNAYVNPETTAYKKRKKKKNDDIIIIGTAANSVDVKYKGQDSVIKSLKFLNKENIKIKYELVGPGEGKYLKKVANKYGQIDNVSFVGTKVKEEVLEWLDTIDIYIQPSKQEGLPRALIEAMSRGCYCLGTNIAGIPELLGDSFMFKPGNYKKIANLIYNYVKINEDDFKEICRQNYSVSCDYATNILEKRRKEFFLKYKKKAIRERENYVD